MNVIGDVVLSIGLLLVAISGYLQSKRLRRMERVWVKEMERIWLREESDDWERKQKTLRRP